VKPSPFLSTFLFFYFFCMKAEGKLSAEKFFLLFHCPSPVMHHTRKQIPLLLSFSSVPFLSGAKKLRDTTAPFSFSKMAKQAKPFSPFPPFLSFSPPPGVDI